MSLLTIRLGYGKTGTVELDVFTRLLNNQLYDNEEIRVDRPVDLTADFEYVAVATAGSSPDDPVWSCIRRSWINKHVVRIQYQSGIPWTYKELGWI